MSLHLFSSLVLNTSSLSCLLSALANLEATRVVQSVVEGLEARLATLKKGMVDMSTTEEAVERAQVSFHQISLNADIMLTDKQTN